MGLATLFARCCSAKPRARLQRTNNFRNLPGLDAEAGTEAGGNPLEMSVVDDADETTAQAVEVMLDEADLAAALAKLGLSSAQSDLIKTLSLLRQQQFLALPPDHQQTYLRMLVTTRALQALYDVGAVDDVSLDREGESNAATCSS